jgi:hypothetical protein
MQISRSWGGFGFAIYAFVLKLLDISSNASYIKSAMYGGVGPF